MAAQDPRVLAARIRAELKDLDVTMERAGWALEKLAPGDESGVDLRVDAAALNLHSLYGGLERLFEAVSLTIDHAPPTGGGWHRSLLDQMTLDIPGLRPPVLSPVTADGLSDLLSFRQAVRNVYALHLDPERVALVYARAASAYTRAREELVTFAGWLERAAEPG